MIICFCYRLFSQSILVLGLMSTGTLVFAEANAKEEEIATDYLWTAGIEYYGKGEYSEALAGFSRIPPEERTAEVYYNLGNTYFQLGDYGLASLNLERALLLKPGFQEAATNLDLTWEKAKALPARRQALIPDGFPISLDAAMVTGLTAFWLVVLPLTSAILFRRMRGAMLGLASLGLILFAASVIAILDLWQGRAHPDAAIVLTKDTALRETPVSSGKVLNRLTAATRVRADEETRGDWRWVEAPAGESGWVMASAVERIRPADDGE